MTCIYSGIGVRGRALLSRCRSKLAEAHVVELSPQRPRLPGVTYNPTFNPPRGPEPSYDMYIFRNWGPGPGPAVQLPPGRSRKRSVPALLSKPAPTDCHLQPEFRPAAQAKAFR